jgi:membrane protease YdiL (CAAX protease family)
MNPIEPSSEPVYLTPLPNPQPPIPSSPFFDYTDLFFFIGLCVPCLLISVMLVRTVRLFVHIPTSVQLLVIQSVWYFLAFGSVAALFRLRYRQPFWQSLGWRPLSFSGAIGALLIGPLLALSIGLLGSALRTPEIDLPFQQMLRSPGTIVLLGIVVVILGPVCEELAFRGFLMPLLVRSLGVTAGIVLTGVIFGSIHGYEYQWSWRHILLISTAGCIFGWARNKTQSTLAAAFMHSTFNLTQFAAFLVQARTL